jgi:putative transposase
MPRLSRLTIAGELHFVLQRGQGGRRVFADDIDRLTYLEALRDAAETHDLAVHAYVLLEDEIQWLATPQKVEDLGLTVQSTGRRFVGAINRRHGMRGSCWDGRFRSAVVDGRAHAVELVALVEQEPVIRGLAPGAPDWPWSSAAHHLGTARVPWLRDHPALWSLGNTPYEREAAYAHHLRTQPDPALRNALHRAAARGWALGSDAFVARLQRKALPRAVRPQATGRPRAT